MEAVLSAYQNQSLNLGNLTGNKTKKPGELTEAEADIIQTYINLGKQLLKQNTCLDVFYFSPSLNTIVENDLQRWGYVDPHHPAVPTMTHTQPSTVLPPPPTAPPTHHRTLSNGSISSVSSTNSARSKVALTINTTMESGQTVLKSPSFSGSNTPLQSPKRSDIIKCSNDNTALFADISRRTGGNLHLFFGSLHLEDNVSRLKSVSNPTQPDPTTLTLLF